MKELVITDKNSGGRLDKIIFRYLDKASSGFVYKMLRKKNITLNDHRAKGNEILKAGDSVKLYLSDETIARFRSGLSVKEAGKQSDKKTETKNYLGAKLKLSISLKTLIAFEDENIIAVNKPAGLLSQKAAQNDTSVNDFILEHVPGDEYFTPGIANRLDRNTSGLILAGKNLNAQRELVRAIASRTISKYYLTAVKGSVSEPINAEAWLVKDGDSNTVSVSDVRTEGADHIVTRYRPLAQSERMTLLEVELVTGRSHQIRAHLSYLGHPVAGDTKYGDEELNRFLREKYQLRSQLLHAYRIEFDDVLGILEYLNGQKIEAELPSRFRTIIEGEGLWLPGTPED